ncbi:hypothetical protein N0V88_002593 [Collariella sp. IMI 366227]|nr:hypothetical protein N0V88_002593 [Collariella sp. IMI 366227]
MKLITALTLFVSVAVAAPAAEPAANPAGAVEALVARAGGCPYNGWCSGGTCICTPLGCTQFCNSRGFPRD